MKIYTIFIFHCISPKKVKLESLYSCILIQYRFKTQTLYKCEIYSSSLKQFGIEYGVDMGY